MQQSKDKDETGSKTMTDAEIAQLVAETRISRAIQRQMASASKDKPAPTLPSKKPSE